MATIQPNQPDQLFAWLAGVMSARGPFACRSVRCDAEGTLTITLGADQGDVAVSWRVPAPRPAEPRYRDGSIAVHGHEAPGDAVARDAIRQVTGTIDSLARRWRIELLDRRNRELDTVELGMHFASSVFGELLVEGETRCGLWVFRGATPGPDGVALLFRGLAAPLELRVQAAGTPAEGKVVGTYGPLALVAPPDAEQRHDADRVLSYVGYLLALSVPPGAKLVSAAQADRASDTRSTNDEPDPQVDPRLPLDDRANPFFFDRENTAALLFSALSASRGRVSAVMHTDRECVGFTSHFSGSVEPVHLYRLDVRPTTDYVRRVRIVDTSDLDAIMTGCEDRLTELTREAAEDERPELLVVLGTCVSRIIGDDVERSARDSGALDAGVPTIWLEATASEDQQARVLWTRLCELFQSPRGAAGGGPSVNLFGYGSWRDQDHGELEELLRSIGVRRNASLIPTFDIDELKRMGDADVNLALRAPLVLDSLMWAREKLQAPLLEPPSPFGIAGTRSWLDAILRFFGRAPVGDEWMKQHLGPLAERWAELVRQAAELRVAILITSDHFGSAVPLHRGGVPLFDVLREMGFPVDLFVLPTPGKHVDTHERAVVLETMVRRIPHDTLSWVASMQELRDRLEQSGCHLFYTEVPLDRRAPSAGMATFNYTDFDMGFAGACRSLERLIHRGHTPFWRRYAPHIPCPDW